MGCRSSELLFHLDVLGEPDGGKTLLEKEASEGGEKMLLWLDESLWVGRGSSRGSWWTLWFRLDAASAAWRGDPDLDAGSDLLPGPGGVDTTRSTSWMQI